MCGRTACTLAPDDICKACTYQNSKGQKVQPKWQDPPGGQKYFTSYNMAPGSHTPILLQNNKKITSYRDPYEEECAKEKTYSEFIVQPMHWGLVPSWHKGDPKSVGFNMSNARSDGMLEKTSFKKPLERGQRCVVLCEGYYEWNTSKDGSKQPYYIYFNAPSHLSSSDKEECQLSGDAREGLDNKQLITMAGLYDIWKPQDGGAPIYSYSIITVDAHKKIGWLHHRMPALLHGEEEIQKWLNSGSVDLSEAVKLIRPTEEISWHPVSTMVNSSKNKSPECIKPIDLEKQKKKAQASSNFMKAWLGQSKRKSDESDALSKKLKKS